ncbi:MAG: prolyl oligopeptidase family serine peptidase [Agarilytica sp.]
MKQQAPYGSWTSPITASLVAGKTPKLFDTLVNDNRIFWCESIAEEKGRTAIMMYDGIRHQCVLPRPLSAKSKVHEYGGKAYAIDGNSVYFVLADDQRVYHGDMKTRTAEENDKAFTPTALTPPTNAGHTRYADLAVDRKHCRVIAVQECHDDNDPHKVENRLVAFPTNREERSDFSIQTLSEGHDFYSNPCISPCGNQLLWLTWDHPDMPWDNTQLWVADLNASGLSNTHKIVGNGDESIFQPQWSAKGDLYFVSDRNNWWNIYTIPKEALHDKHKATPQLIIRHDAEYATPQWVFGMSTYGFWDENTLLATFTQHGVWQLVKIHLDKPEDQCLEIIPTGMSCIENVSCHHHLGVFIAASPTQAKTIFALEDNTASPLTHADTGITTEEYSQPQPITFPTTFGQAAHALFYPPQNTQYGDEQHQPPLIVISHGGPTGATESSLNLKIQYWTNRGFAVADVNYRGSTGYGREYRHRLFKQWGRYDVDDVCAVVDYLSKENLIDPNKCIIKGSSAGGYTVLAALTFKDTFKAGVSLYGIGDLELLATDTHKFEARYLDKLIGPYPETADEYRARSPIHFVNQINCPLLIFQGLLDKVVPPNQAELMVSAVKQKGLPIAYVTYPNEAHGFRQFETIEHMLDAEHQFYARIFGLEFDTPENPLQIDNI